MPSLPQCPAAYPADDDLTGVVTHLGRISTRGGKVPRDPNEPEVRWLLEAGIRALGEAVLARCAHAGDAMAYSSANGIFDALPLERVMAAFRDMCRENGIDPGSANKARLIRRWSFAANYQLDLVAYLFRPEVHRRRLAHVERDLTATMPQLSLSDLVDLLTQSETLLEPISTAYRLQHVLRMMFPADENIRRHAAVLYDIQIAHWSRAYATIITAYGLPIPLEHVTDLAAVLGLTVEGAFVRSTGLPRHVTCTDGTSAAAAAVRSIIAATAGLPWTDLADRLPDVRLLEQESITGMA